MLKNIAILILILTILPSAALAGPLVAAREACQNTDDPALDAALELVDFTNSLACGLLLH